MKKKVSLRVPVTAAVFAALSIVLGKLLAINIGDTIRISFENLPIILASLMLGPVWGAACGAAADLVGCLIRGFAINPFITAAMALMGVVPWLFARRIFRSLSVWSVALTVVISHIICSMIVKTVALHIAFSTPYAGLFATRVPLYAGISVLEAYICAMILRSSAVRKEFDI